MDLRQRTHGPRHLAAGLLIIGLLHACGVPAPQIENALSSTVQRIDPHDQQVLRQIIEVSGLPSHEIDVKFPKTDSPAEHRSYIDSAAAIWVFKGRIVGLYLHGNDLSIRCAFIRVCLSQKMNWPGFGLIARLRRLRFLHLHTFEIPEEDKLSQLGQLPRLEQLAITGCDLPSLAGIERLRGLRSLDVSMNLLTSINELGQLSRLRYLRLANNQLTNIEPVSRLVHLQMLDIKSNRVSYLPDLTPLTRLHSISLSDNALRQINFDRLSKVGSLARIKELWLDGNRLASLVGIGAFRHLEALRLDNNQLESLAGIDELRRLKTLYVSHNRLRGLDPVYRVASLETLWVTDNRISRFSALRLPPRISSIYVCRNPIDSLSGLARLLIPLRKLQHISLRGTPLVQSQRSSLESLAARIKQRIWLEF